MTNKDKLIVALDFSSIEEAKSMVNTLGESVSFYKIGLELLGSGSYFSFLEWLKTNNKKVFADLKFFDIPATVGAAVRQISNLGADYLTIHGEPQIMQAANENKEGNLKILAVTVLTSLDENDIKNMGYRLSIQDLVNKRAKSALELGIDGTISSVHEAASIRKLCGEEFIIVTPGIRLADKNVHDQKRVATPETAIRNGASHMVVGRAITQAKNPAMAANLIQEIINNSL